MKPALLSPVLLLGSFAAAAAEPDVQAGHALARTVCSACHLVDEETADAAAFMMTFRRQPPS